MSPDVLDTALSQEPFQPLRVHLNDGTSFEITNPSLVVIARFVLYYFNPIRPKSHRGVNQTIVSLRNISRIEVLDQASAA